MEQRPSSRRWVIRVVLYLMLLVSAGAAFLLNDWLWRSARHGTLPAWAPLLPVITFTAFVVVYVVDRWLLIRRRHYPPVRAFFQVAIAVAFLALLLPQQARELRRSQGASASGVARLLEHRDPDVRAAACELAGYRGQTELASRVQTLSAKDPSTLVREACRDALERMRDTPRGAP